MTSLYETSPENCLGRTTAETSSRPLGYGIPPDVPILGQSSNADDRHALWTVRDPSLPVLGQSSSRKSGKRLIYDS